MKTAMYGLFLLLLWTPAHSFSADSPISSASQECLDCHSIIHPGIVNDWRQSRHAQTTPQLALAVTGPARKVSAASIPACWSTILESLNPPKANMGRCS